ncbi:MAG: homoserine kinase [Methyloglobulus sp.]|nr:homoserine kinase [Methyloglobulus sp.]
MSVYSAVTRTQLEQFVNQYPLGKVIAYEGIEDGIDNTNYFVTTTQGEFVLTLFESLSADKLPYYLNLLCFLGENNLPCPNPYLNNQARSFGSLNHKQAAVFKRFPGRSAITPSIAQCHEIGLHLGRLHRLTENHVFPINSNHDLRWCKSVFNKIDSHLTSSDRSLISDEMNFLSTVYTDNLPKGVIHGDLFKDNALFIDDRLTGLLDFYSAGTGILSLDIAITVNDWCYGSGEINLKKLFALLTGYESIRQLEQSEKQIWPSLLRAAALRFWLSRLQHQLFPPTSKLTQYKDPSVFRQLLQQYRQRPITL